MLVRRMIWALPIALMACNGAAGNSSTPDTTAPTSAISPESWRGRGLPGELLLIASEPATIYYTVDGSEPTTNSPSSDFFAIVESAQDGVPVQFFAVDAAGNMEAEINSATFSSDRTGPNAVSNFAATVATSTASLSWTNPNDDDFAGVLIARSTDGTAAISTPTSGVTYTAGDLLPGGDIVLFVGDASAFDDPSFNGMRGYSAFPFDDLHNYGPMENTMATQPFEPATGSISIALDGTVTVVSPIPGFDLRGEALYSDDDDRLQIAIELTNETGGPLLNGRAQLQNISQGSTGLNQFRGDPTLSFNGSLEANERRRWNFDLDSIDGTQDPITFDLLISRSPILLSGLGTIDASGFNGQIGPGLGTRGVVLSPDGNHSIGGSKRYAGIAVVDLISGATVAALDTTGFGEFGSASNPALSGNNVYFARTRGAHYNGTGGDSGGSPAADNGTTIDFLGYDATTFAELGSVSIPTGNRATARLVAVNQNGSMAAVISSRFANGGNTLSVVDLSNFQLLDVDPVTVGIQTTMPLSSNVGVAEAAVFDADDKLYVGYKNRCNNQCAINGGDETTPPPLDVLDGAAGFAFSSDTAPNNSLAVTTMAVRNGNLYYASRNGLAIWELGTSNVTNVTLPFSMVSGLAFSEDGTRYYVNSGNSNCEIALVDTSTNTLLDIDDHPENGTDTTGFACTTPHARMFVTSL